MIDEEIGGFKMVVDAKHVIDKAKAYLANARRGKASNIKQSIEQSKSNQDFQKKLERFRNRILPHKSNFKFKGYDYTELLTFYNVKPVSHLYSDGEFMQHEDINVEILRNILREVVDSPNRKNVEICNEAICAFLKAMLRFKKIDIRAPLWEAALTLKKYKDLELIKFVYHTCELMWT